MFNKPPRTSDPRMWVLSSFTFSLTMNASAITINIFYYSKSREYFFLVSNAESADAWFVALFYR